MPRPSGSSATTQLDHNRYRRRTNRTDGNDRGTSRRACSFGRGGGESRRSPPTRRPRSWEQEQEQEQEQHLCAAVPQAIDGPIGRATERGRIAEYDGPSGPKSLPCPWLKWRRALTNTPPVEWSRLKCRPHPPHDPVLYATAICPESNGIMGYRTPLIPPSPHRRPTTGRCTRFASDPGRRPRPCPRPYRAPR